MLKHPQKVFQNATIATLGVLAALVLLEIGARLLPPPFADQGNKADVCSDQYGWRGAPNFKTIVATEGYVHDLTLNSLGMHDEEHTRSKSANTFRILMLGDSFVRAHQVKEVETAHQVLERLLNRGDLIQNHEVISSGVDGWGTGQQLLYYRAEGRFYEPDLVLLMLYLGNDVTDNLPGRGITITTRNCYAPYFVLSDDRLDVDPWLYAPGLAPATGPYSPILKTFTNILGKLYQYSRLYARLEPLFAARQLRVSGIDFYTGQNELFDYGLELTFALTRQLYEEVSADGAEFMVVLISPLALIDFARMSPTERQEVYDRLPDMRRAEELDPPNQIFAARLSGQDIKVLDLFPIFMEQIDRTGETLHFRADKHWNVAGNRLVGEAIYNWLHENQEVLLKPVTSEQ